MASSSIAFTMYPVTDLPRAVAFYRDALGLPTTDVQSDYWVEFDVGGATFGVGNFEQVGTPGARSVLQTLARGAPGAALTCDARRASTRLEKE